MTSQDAGISSGHHLLAGDGAQAPCKLPLRNREGDIVGVVLFDEADRALIETGPSWHLGSGGYARRQLSIGSPPTRRVWAILMHRLIMGVGPGGPHVDHINRNRLDNRRSNLRLVTRAQQAQNVMRPGTSSKYRGVSWTRGRWAASARVDGRRVYLGCYAHELQAAHAAQQWRIANMTHTVEDVLPPAPPIEPKLPTPPQPCANCGRPYKPLRRGRCSRCSSYLRKHGQERPYSTGDGRQRPHGRSRHRGVTWHRAHQKWMATGRLDGKVHYLGYFTDELEAAQRAAAWRAAHGLR